MSTAHLFTVGQLARTAGVHLETVRYYERRGLLPVPGRTAAGYRQYPPEAARRVIFIRRAQALGFTLDEIGALLDLRTHPGESCSTVERQARMAIERLDQRMAELQRMRAGLVRLAGACGSEHVPGACPLLDAIEPVEERVP